MVCLHATDPATVYLSAWARVDGLRVDDMDRALYVDRTLVKHLAMRRTLFVFPRHRLSAAQSGPSVRVHATERTRLIRDVERAGLVDDGYTWLKQAAGEVLATLVPGREATSSEIRQDVPLLEGGVVYGEGKKWGGSVPVGPRVLTVLSTQGKILRGSNVGGWTTSRPRWTATESWLGEPIEEVDTATAYAELVRSWLTVFGPGTVKDIQWWLGSTISAVRAALKEIGAIEVDLDGVPGVALPDDLEPTGGDAPWVALLPSLDPTTMGWQQRDWYLGPHKERLFDRAGNAGQSAWCDGRIVGGWHQPDGPDVVLDLWEDVGAETRAALEAEAARLTDWLDGVRIRSRFPGPFQTGSG